jgi:hypothetical protein
MNASSPSTVIPGLVLGIHVFAVVEDVDGRNDCGHDVGATRCACDKGRAR